MWHRSQRHPTKTPTGVQIRCLTMLVLATSAFCQTEAIQSNRGTIIRLSPPALKKLVALKNTGYLMATWSGTVDGLVPSLYIEELPVEGCNAMALLRKQVEAFRAIPDSNITYAAGNTTTKASATVSNLGIRLTKAERFICVAPDLAVRVNADCGTRAGEQPSAAEQATAFRSVLNAWETVSASRGRATK